jgi:hypothetical protein
MGVPRRFVELAYSRHDYVVRNANGQALAYLYSRDNDAEARQANEGRSATDRCEHRAVARAAAPGERRLNRRAVQMPQIGGADDLSAGALRRPSLEGAMSGLTPAPINRVHDPSGVAAHGVALWSAGQNKFRSARIVMALLVSRLAARRAIVGTLQALDADGM